MTAIGAAAEVDEELLERAERRHVEVVGGLVEDDEVGAAREDLGERDARALAAGERADRLALLVGVEEEALQVAAHVERLAADARCARCRRRCCRRSLLSSSSCGAVLIEVGDLGVHAEHDLARRPARARRGWRGAASSCRCRSCRRRRGARPRVRMKSRSFTQREAAERERELAQLEDRLAGARRRRARAARRLLHACGASWPLAASARSMRAFCLVLRALGWRRSHSSSRAEEVLPVRLGARLVREALGLGLEVVLVAAVVAVDERPDRSPACARRRGRAGSGRG